MNYLPEGYTTVSPYIITGDAPATMEFIKTVFGAAQLRLFKAENDRVAHAEFRIGNSVVMLGQPMAGGRAADAHIHVYVPDVDKTYSAALAHGAKSVQVPTKGHDEDKRGGVMDVCGTTWWISTKVEG